MKRQAIALVVLQGLDLQTTWAGLRGSAHEQNPVGAAILGHGFAWLVWAKLAGTAVIICLAYMMHRGNRDQARWTLAWCCFLMLGVVSWNTWIGWLRS